MTYPPVSGVKSLLSLSQRPLPFEGVISTTLPQKGIGSSYFEVPIWQTMDMMRFQHDYEGSKDSFHWQ